MNRESDPGLLPVGDVLDPDAARKRFGETVDALQQQAREQGLDGLTEADIEKEIRATRDARDLTRLVSVARRSPGPIALDCPCGGKVRLDGWAVPRVSVLYRCERCDTVSTSLGELARKGA